MCPEIFITQGRSAPPAATSYFGPATSPISAHPVISCLPFLGLHKVLIVSLQISFTKSS